MSERTTSDQEFVHLFSPKILEKLEEDCLEGAVHIFRSPPGGGKTTILRAFTPNALKAFWHAKPTQTDSYHQLVDRNVLDETNGPQLLGVMLSCAAGYADLPPGSSNANAGLFRALLDCRTVLRALRSLLDFIGLTELDNVRLNYDSSADDLKSIPRHSTVSEMISWAERRERDIYGQLDAIVPAPDVVAPSHVLFESIVWLHAVQFIHKGRAILPKRLLMIDDIQKLRKSQRLLLIDELVNARPQFPIWLAGRTIAFSGGFLGQGIREGRDIREYRLEELWGSGRGSQQFIAFAQNILDRRFGLQTAVPGGSFSQYLAENISSDVLERTLESAMRRFSEDIKKHRKNRRYQEWIDKVEEVPSLVNIEALIEIYVTRILISRDLGNRQTSFDIVALSSTDLDVRDSSSVRGAAEIFLRNEHKLPYYFGIDRLCNLATNNIEELLALAAALYDGMKAKQVLRRQAEPQLTAIEQEKRLRDAAGRKRDFIPKNHSDGTRAQRLLDAIGTFCRDKTFLNNAPYAPGVTGIRLADSEIGKLKIVSSTGSSLTQMLEKVLFECVAENLLVTRPSKASSSREAGTVFYLNRTLCAYHGLPVNYGGWQDLTVQNLSDWMERGLQPSRNRGLDAL